MGISEQEFQTLLDNQKRAWGDAKTKFRDASIGIGFPDQSAPPKSKRRGVPNKLESQFRQALESMRLSGSVLWYEFEGMKFRLADGAWYTPDWIARENTGLNIAIEVKGHWREAARLRIKVAAERYPLESGWRFVAVTKDSRGEWKYEYFGDAA